MNYYKTGQQIHSTHLCSNGILTRLTTQCTNASKTNSASFSVLEILLYWTKCVSVNVILSFLENGADDDGGGGLSIHCSRRSLSL